MWPDRVSNPGPPTYESGALPIALRGPAICIYIYICIYLNVRWKIKFTSNVCRLNFHQIAPHFQGNAHFIKISTDHGAQWFP